MMTMKPTKPIMDHGRSPPFILRYLERLAPGQAENPRPIGKGALQDTTATCCEFPNQARTLGSFGQKGFNYRKTGLETKFKRGDDLASQGGEGARF